METKKNLYFTKTHEWVEFIDENTAKVGITEFAKNALGDIVFITLPEVGTEVQKENAFAEVESVKAVSEIFSPVSGIVSKINEELIDAPEKINDDPFNSWFIEIKDITDKENLLNLKEYEELCENEE